MRLDPSELARAIAAGEGRELELKRGLPGDAKVARTLCAFANTRGGLLLIGVGERGELVGAPRAQAVPARLRAVAAHRIEPPLAVQAGLTVLEGRRIAWCCAPISPARPHAALGDAGEREFVVRVGASNRRAPEATLRSIRAGRLASGKLGELERGVLAWLARRAPGEPATVLAFAREQGVARQRARRAFAELELGGLLFGLGPLARRVYAVIGARQP